MKQSRFTQEQIIGVLKEHRTGATAANAVAPSVALLELEPAIVDGGEAVGGQAALGGLVVTDHGKDSVRAYPHL